jgi:1-acyl-sn-glycerol-3-phosphate acyltransferase
VAGLNRTQRALVVLAYFLGFWIALPAGLCWAGRALDRAAGWDRTVVWWGLLPLAVGAPLLAWAIFQLWREGGGPPVGALPPPHLASRGPYAWVRHPIYEGFVLVILGAALLTGSSGSAGVVVPLFALATLAYALIEERLLLRRFGAAYGAYRRWAGLILPRLSRLLWAAGRAGLIPVRAEGREHIPPAGPVILVANHTCYLDPTFLIAAQNRPIRFPTTAEVFRRPLSRWFMGRMGTICVRRYRPDPEAAADVVDALAAGEVVGFFPERERSVTGSYQGADPVVAAVTARLGVPVVPVGINGGYQFGPRWADTLRRRPVLVRFGPPIDFAGRGSAGAIDAAIRALLDHDPQRLDLAGLPREHLGRVLWQCPACRREDGWRPADLACDRCGAAWKPAPDGLLDGPGGPTTLGALALTQRSGPRRPVEVEAAAEQERSVWGPPQPLQSLGRAALRVDEHGLRFGDLEIPAAALRTVSTERADTLQVAVEGAMWHFRLEGGSVFRLQWMLEAVMPRHHPPVERKATHALAARLGGEAPKTGRR